MAGAVPVTEHDVARVAVFDLDGTITCRDTLLPFLLAYARRHGSGLWRLWRLPFSLARYGLGLSDRGALKAALIRQVMLHASRGTVAACAEGFCRDQLPALLTPGASATIAAHRAAGDRLVLLSASVDLYVPAIARALGFDEAICTGVSWNGDTLAGRLTTPNRRGAEKLRCIEQLRARYPRARLAAYGNAASDFPHLLAVDEPLLVNAGRATRRRATRLGLRCADWRHPAVSPSAS